MDYLRDKLPVGVYYHPSFQKIGPGNQCLFLVNTIHLSFSLIDALNAEKPAIKSLKKFHAVKKVKKILHELHYKERVHGAI